MRTPVLVLLFGAPLFAQANAVPGLDVVTYEVVDARVYGRRGAAYPGGEVGMNLGHSMANCGTVEVTWDGGPSNGLMLPTYPKIASLIARESNGRMVQISGESFCKHSRIAFNFAGGPCAPCQSGSTNAWRLGCSDTYSSGFSGLTTLGPTDEIDPWLGTWNPVGSYFDRGDPAVVGVAASDGIRSPITNSDPLYNRMIVPESELNVPGAVFHGQVQVVVIGEPGTNRGNNITSRQIGINWNGSAWTGTLAGSNVVAPVLTRWTGATTATARNGMDDGHFLVGCKVTGPVDGFWHYEIAVQNLDNAAGGAALRLPACTAARVRNAGFRDIDGHPLNDWTFSRSNGELTWQAAASNSLDWNTIYNFWFDCDAAPVTGNVSIDRARPGPGGFTVAVAAQVPGLLGTQYIGDGCGSPPPLLSANGAPVIPSPGFGLAVRGAASAPTLLVLSTQPDHSWLGGACTQFVDLMSLTATGFLVADGSGLAAWQVPLPPYLSSMDVFCQGVQIVNGGPLYGALALSNGMRVRLGGTGCQ